MITPQRITSRFRDIEPFLGPLREQVRQTVQAFSDRHGFAVSSRVKTLASLSEKIETGRYRSWSELDDLVAVTIVVPTLSYEQEVLNFLRVAFSEVEIKLRGSTKKAPDVFRFDSTRFVGMLRTREGVAQSNIANVKFEVQIKSAFEHAWSVTTHALTYKGPSVKWNRLRLTAQLKATVEQLDLLVLAFEEAALRIEESLWPEIEAQENIAAFFRAAVTDGVLPEELTPKDWSRFCNNVFHLASDSKWGARKQPQEVTEAITAAVSAELAELGRDNVPMSISLWQFTFAALCKGQILQPPLRRSWPIITPELELLYPIVTQFVDRFDYSS